MVHKLDKDEERAMCGVSVLRCTCTTWRIYIYIYIGVYVVIVSVKCTCIRRIVIVKGDV